MRYKISMAAPHPRLIEALRETARRLREGKIYKWSNYGLCNCGYLAQTVTDKTPKQIHEAALVREGDWGKQALEYCGQTGLEIDTIISEMLALGLTQSDIHDIERLSNPSVRRRMAPRDEGVAHYSRTDAIDYLEAWADLLEEQLPEPVGMAAK